MKQAVLVALLTAMLPTLASAHATLEQSSPADGSVVAAAPESVMLTFSESAHLTALSIRRQSEARAQPIGPLPKGEDVHFRVALPRLSPGRYTLSYRTLATDDGHVSAGAITFTVAPAAGSTQ